MAEGENRGGKYGMKMSIPVPRDRRSHGYPLRTSLECETAGKRQDIRVRDERERPGQRRQDKSIGKKEIIKHIMSRELESKVIHWSCHGLGLGLLWRFFGRFLRFGCFRRTLTVGAFVLHILIVDQDCLINLSS